MSETMKEAYAAYLASADKVIEISGRPFFRVIHKDVLHLPDAGTEITSVAISVELKAKVGSTLIDEKGNEYVIDCYERFNYKFPLPAWSTEVCFPVFKGIDTSGMGNYLAKM